MVAIGVVNPTVYDFGFPGSSSRLNLANRIVPNIRGIKLINPPKSGGNPST